MEIITVIPMHGPDILQGFINKNDWVKNYFPVKTNPVERALKIKRSFAKKIIEKLFDSNFGEALDNWLMNLTDKRWQKKTAQHKLNDKGICMGMKVGKHFSKPDPKNFQEKVVRQYETKINSILPVKNNTSETIFRSVLFFEAK